MAFQIPARHPLRRLFAELVRRRLVLACGLDDPALQDYIAGVLTDFTHVDNLFRIRNASGKRLEDVGEMLLESNPILRGRSFDHEREVRKHIGDYTLFLAGLFPEYVARLPRRSLRLDSLIDYVKAGKESYAVVASFNLFEYRHDAPLFARLSDNFELCVFALNGVKRELDQMRQTDYRAVAGALRASL
jgi:hypothetical protein